MAKGVAALVLVVILLAGCGGSDSHKRSHVGLLTPEQAYTITGFSPAQTYTLGNSGARPHHRSSHSNPNGNVYISSSDFWPLQASPPSLTVLKQYTLDVPSGLPGVVNVVTVQVVKIPGFGRCVVTNTDGVWCK